MSLQKTDDEKNERQIRAQKILAEARANLVGYVPREQRVAEELKRARENIARPIEREAAIWRRERIKRELADARTTLARTAHLEPPSHVPGEIVHKIKENAYVAPEAPSSNLREPKVNDLLAERGLDAPIDWEARISEAIATEREFLLAVMGESLGETCAAQRKEIDIELREMRIELAELRIANTELRHRMSAEGGKFGDAPIDLPNPICRRAN